jgi:hypothetical protein
MRWTLDEEEEEEEECIYIYIMRQPETVHKVLFNQQFLSCSLSLLIMTSRGCPSNTSCVAKKER